MSRPRSPTTWRRSLAALMCIMVAFAWVGAALHDAHAEHHRCAEHGEWIHVGVALDVRDGGAPDDDGDDEHEHCALLAAHTTPALDLAGAPAGIESPPLTGTSLADPLSAPWHRQRGARLRFAPKTSPPAIG